MGPRRLQGSALRRRRGLAGRDGINWFFPAIFTFSPRKAHFPQTPSRFPYLKFQSLGYVMKSAAAFRVWVWVFQALRALFAEVEKRVGVWRKRDFVGKSAKRWGEKIHHGPGGVDPQGQQGGRGWIHRGRCSICYAVHRRVEAATRKLTQASG